MLKNYLFLEDTQNDPMDGYGDRLVLELDQPSDISSGQPLSLTARVLLDGKRMPVIPFPENPDTSKEKIDVAIAAAVVIEDVDQDLDKLYSFTLKQQTVNTIGGSIGLDKLETGTYAVKLVVRSYTGRRFNGRPTNPQAIRTAKAVFNYGGQIQQGSQSGVWLIEYLGPFQQPNTLRARLRLFEPTGQIASIKEAVMVGAVRLPQNYRFEKRSLTTTNTQDAVDDASLFFLSPKSNGKTVLATANEDGSLLLSPEIDIFPLAYGHSAVLDGWAWARSRASLAHIYMNVIAREFPDYVSVSALVVSEDDSVWVMAAKRNQAGGTSIEWLRKVDKQGNTIAEVPTVRSMGFEAGAILRSMADGGVTAYCRYGTVNTIVRIGPGGNIIASAQHFMSNVLDLGVNPYTGECALVRFRPGEGIEAVRLNPALTIFDYLRPRDTRFGKAFERLWSCDISAPESGQRIWVSGQRKERQPSGVLLDRGAIGFLENDQFTLVQGGMETMTLIRALR